MCELCRAEYEDPLDRRFHAQPNACPVCGPSLRLVDRAGRPWPGNEAALEGAPCAGRGQDRRRQGARRLPPRLPRRRRVGGRRAAGAQAPRGQALCPDGALGRGGAGAGRADDAAGALLDPRERAHRARAARPDATVAPSVAPASRELGVMLPYSPLHHLLLDDSGAVLVMTSANVSDEPIAYRDEDALERLAGIADLFLMHDRPIETRTDDSVLRVVADRPAVPAALARLCPARPAARPPRPILACGAELKNTFCVAKGGRAWVGHHIGDLENYETLRSFTEGIEHFERLFAVEPELVAHDLHPGVPLHQVRARAGGRRDDRGAAPSRPSRRVPGGAWRARSGDRGDLRRDRLRHGRDGVGRGAPAGRPARLRARGHSSRADAGRRARHSPAVEDGLCLAARDARRGEPPLPPLLAGAVAEDAWRRSSRAGGERAGVARDDERRAGSSTLSRRSAGSGQR